MTLLTPNFADKVNGSAGAPMHIVQAHEPLGTGERPPFLGGINSGLLAAMKPPTAAAAAPLKVALIGTAPSSRMLAPYGDPSWKIWGCSPGNMNQLPRVDLWFELHSNLLWPEHQSYGVPYIEWMKQQKFPIYDMVREFGRDFFTSSFSWMMALAIKMGATEIALYGIDMASRDEYILQRPGFYFFKLEAERRGIRVSAPHESDIMQSPPLYAYADSTPIGRKIFARETEVKGRVAGFDQQIGQATHNKTYLQGALEDLDYFKSIWGGAMDEIVLLKAENAHLKAEVARLNAPAPMQMGLNPISQQNMAMPPPNKRKRQETRHG
jgi:hypothetical protein